MTKADLTPGYFYHIYNRAVDGNFLFKESKNYFFFITKLKKYLLPGSDVIAYCLMPNHFHLIVKVRTSDFSALMHKFALSYVVSYNNLYNRKGHLFNGRFRRKLVKNSTNLLQLSRYIHSNPVKANLVNKAENWQFSSYCEYIGLRKRDFIVTDIVLDMISDDLNSSITEQHNTYRRYIEDHINEIKRDRVP